MPKGGIVGIDRRGSSGPASRFEAAPGSQQGLDHIIAEHDQGGHGPQSIWHSFIPACFAFAMDPVFAAEFFEVVCGLPAPVGCLG